MMTTHVSPHVLVIGLDVGDASLIHEWSQDGTLPVLGSLLQQGAWGQLGTSADTLHVSAWPSLYTGTMPGKHGVYYTFQPRPGRQGVQRFGPDQYGQPPVWQILSEAGKRCIVFDAPYTNPHRTYRGLQIFEWGTWAWYWQPMSVPPKLMRQLTGQCGAYPVGFEANHVGLGPLDLDELHRRLIKAVGSKAGAVRWLMAEHPWDLFWVVFGETHPAAHYFWPPAKPSATTVSPERSSALLKDVYQAIDRAIGEILNGCGDEVTVFVISGDGVGPNHAGWHFLPEVLQKLGFTALVDREPPKAAPGRPPNTQRKDLLKALRDLVPPHLRQSLSHYLPTRWRDSLMSRWTTANIDWSRTRAFCLPTDLEGCIRLNIRGREPQGILQEGAECEQVYGTLTTALEQLVNPLTGRPAVRHVIRTDQVLPGERRAYLPDLIVLWAHEAEMRAVQAPGLPLIEAPSPDARTGTHYPPGFVIARGPAVKPGHVLENGHIVDLAPTIVAEFGLPRPQQMDGQPWSTLWER